MRYIILVLIACAAMASDVAGNQSRLFFELAHGNPSKAQIADFAKRVGPAANLETLKAAKIDGHGLWIYGFVKRDSSASKMSDAQKKSPSDFDTLQFYNFDGSWSTGLVYSAYTSGIISNFKASETIPAACLVVLSDGNSKYPYQILKMLVN